MIRIAFIVVLFVMFPFVIVLGETSISKQRTYDDDVLNEKAIAYVNECFSVTNENGCLEMGDAVLKLNDNSVIDSGRAVEVCSTTGIELDWAAFGAVTSLTVVVKCAVPPEVLSETPIITIWDAYSQSDLVGITKMPNGNLSGIWLGGRWTHTVGMPIVDTKKYCYLVFRHNVGTGYVGNTVGGTWLSVCDGASMSDLYFDVELKRRSTHLTSVSLGHTKRSSGFGGMNEWRIYGIAAWDEMLDEKQICMVVGRMESETLPREVAISPASGTTFDSSLTISMSCAGEGATIRYTTDGSEPTMESQRYKRFRIHSKTTVKARAFYEDGNVSEVVTAEYALGRCEFPIIKVDDLFVGKKWRVSMACATEGAILRYTVDGSIPNQHSMKYVNPFCVTNSCTIKVVAFKNEWFDSELVAHEVVINSGNGDSVALPEQTFTTSGDAEWVDASGEAMKSGTIADNQKSILSTMFVGKGVLSFKWKVSCEEDTEEHNWDHAAFFVDGVEIARQDGQTDWLDVTHTIEAEGSHTVEWVYVKDEAEADGEDCMWVKDIIWMPERTQTSEVKVETTWLKTYFPTLGSYYFDYEEKANDTAANGINKIWEAYLIGLDPTDSAAKFVSSIAIEDGKPVVSWDPDLGGARAYTILGSTDLKTWTKVEEGRASDYNFFKVSVEMK